MQQRTPRASLLTCCPAQSCRRPGLGNLGAWLLSSADGAQDPSSRSTVWADAWPRSVCKLGTWVATSTPSAKAPGAETRVPSRERFPRRLDSTLAISDTLQKRKTQECYLWCRTTMFNQCLPPLPPWEPRKQLSAAPASPGTETP